MKGRKNMIKTISRDEAIIDAQNALEMVSGLARQLEVIFHDQTQGSRTMTQKEYHDELIAMLPALRATAECCSFYCDSVFDYLNDSPDFKVIENDVKEG